MRALPAPWATAVRACLLRARGALGDDHVFPGDDERRIGRDEVGLVRPDVSVLLRGRRHTHRLRSEEHTSELQSRVDLVCRLLLEKKKKKIKQNNMLI